MAPVTKALFRIRLKENTVSNKVLNRPHILKQLINGDLVLFVL